MKKKQIENYILGQVLGEGSFGKVYKGTNAITNQQYAVKVIPVQKFQQNSRLEDCSANQIKNLTRMEANPHIIKFVEMLKTPNNFYFVYEYCNGKTLESKLKQQIRLNESEAMKIFGQLLEAFKILNKYNIMHRDLKPDNIFFHNGNIKLGDFGFCKSLMTQDDMTSTMLGSPIYMAPEVLRGEIYTSKADIWSLGVVLYEMIYGHCPFESNSIAKLIAVLDNDELKFPEDVMVSQTTKNLIKKLLIKDQFKRTDWFELLTMNTSQQNKYIVSVTQSLSALESEKLSMELRKYSSFRSNDDSTQASITSSSSSKLLRSLGGTSTQQKTLTFRKKSDQNNNKPNDHTKFVKSTSLKNPQNINPELPQQYEPLQKVQTNIPSAPAFKRKLSSQPSKRSELLSSHNSCLVGLRTAINFFKQGDKNSTILGVIILRRIQQILIKITDSIGFNELQLSDILQATSDERRQIQKQIKQMQRQLQRSNIQSSEIFAVKSTLRYYYNSSINKCLWFEMICFLNEDNVDNVNDQRQWDHTIHQYLAI